MIASVVVVVVATHRYCLDCTFNNKSLDWYYDLEQAQAEEIMQTATIEIMMMMMMMVMMTMLHHTTYKTMVLNIIVHVECCVELRIKAFFFVFVCVLSLRVE